MKKSISAFFLFSFLFFLLPRMSWSQEKERREEGPKTQLHHEIVVTATRLETPAREIASAMTIISGEELRRRGLTTVAQALALIPEVTLTQNGGPGSTASVLLRGAGSEHTLVLIDGVEVNDPISPARSFDLAHLLLTEVERIEILYGPQSPLYGSDAMAGVIHIITKKGGDRRVSLMTEVGSLATFKAGVAASGQINKLSYGLSGTRFQTGGLSAASSIYPGNTERDGYINTTVTGRLDWQFRPQKELGLNFRYLKAKTDLDNFGGPYGDDPNNRQDLETSFFKLDYRSLSLTNRWEQKISLAFVANNRRNINPEDKFHPGERDEGNFKSRLLQLDWQNNFFLHEAHTLTCGLEAEKEDGESEYSWASPWGKELSLFPRRQSSSMGFYLQDHLRIGSYLFATAGLRLDRHSRSGLSLTYRLAPALWIATIATRLRVTLGTGFKAPSLYQLYAPGTSWGPIGNPELRPEKTLSWDIGLDQVLFEGQFSLRATYFYSRFRDLIQFDFLQGYQNIGRARSCGFQLETAFKPASILSGRLTLNWLDARDLTSRERLLRRPRFQAGAELEFRPAATWKLIASLIHVGNRDDIDYSSWPGERVQLPPFSLVHATLLILPRPHLTFQLRLENLTNRHYELIKGYGAPGFTVYAGVTWSL